MAQATKVFSEVPVTTYEERQTGITLKLSLDEASMLSSLLGQCETGIASPIFEALLDAGAEGAYDVENCGSDRSPDMSLRLTKVCE